MTLVKTNLSCDILIIGNGFAGRAVAGSLDGDVLIVERGEKFNIFERRSQFNAMKKSNRHSALIRQAYESKHEFNTPERLGDDCGSEYILVDGGCSNHWGGLSFRLTQAVFDQPNLDDQWPFSYSDITPYYNKAEQLLRLSADPRDPDSRNLIGTIQGGDLWREAMDSFFPSAYLGAQAHNLALNDQSKQGVCLGAGDCELCPMDAKTRSAHLEMDHQVVHETVVRSLIFEGNKAVKALCDTNDGPLEINFNRVIVAAHGVESLKLLWNSKLPEEAPQHLIGHFYQDHAVAELACQLPGTMLPYMQTNTASQVIIPELSGEVFGIEYTTLGLMTRPSGHITAAALDLDMLNSSEIETAIKQLGSVLHLYVLLEIPPHWGLSMSYTNGKLNVDSSGYHENKGIYDQVIEAIYSKMKSLGVKPVLGAENLHYKHSYGTHHIMGTLNMSTGVRGVVDADFKLKGTSNVYIAGSSLFPRCGSRNPTVTVVALSLMLADKLNRVHR